MAADDARKVLALIEAQVDTRGMNEALSSAHCPGRAHRLIAGVHPNCAGANNICCESSMDKRHS
jgi:hypothetical protein